ncbi:MAG: LLM class flavin-dependent oxidoreductase [Chloroflexota bacterium]
MEIGIGLDATLNLTFEEQAQVSQEAARLGYTSIWTTETTGHDAFQTCAIRWAATRQVVPGGLTTGIAVSPVALRTPMSLAMGGGTVSDRTGGRFILGIGSGGLYREEERRSLGIKASVIGLMRDYLTAVRALVAGETVTYEGTALTLRGAHLTIEPPPRTPVHLGALGPQMLRLGGERADGVDLNWCTPEQIAWSRERVAEGAARTGRDPSSVTVAEYIRVCVDDDVELARQAFVRNMLGYALGRHGAGPRERNLGYRAHFERMGFTQSLAQLDDMRNGGAALPQLVNAFPCEMAQRVGYFGQAAGAARAFRSLAQGLDIAIVRVVAARPGVEHVLATLRAGRPSAVGA